MISSLRNQRTLRRPARVSGFGYWSGQDVRLEFRPAPPDSGVAFLRRDLSGKPRIPAHTVFGVGASRRTNLVLGAATVEMVEHVMAALAGLGIDNCEVWANAAEMPGCDGSSLPFVTALQGAGFEEQEVPRLRLTPAEPIRVGDDQAWVEIRPHRDSQAPLRVRYELDYGPDSPIACQAVELDVTPESFAAELAPARTFVLAREAQAMRDLGLGKRVKNSDLLVFDQGGVVENTLRFPDECARHKALDLVGDLALIGCDLAAEVSAHRSGHGLNAALGRALFAQWRSRSRRQAA